MNILGSWKKKDYSAEPYEKQEQKSNEEKCRFSQQIYLSIK